MQDNFQYGSTVHSIEDANRSSGAPRLVWGQRQSWCVEAGRCITSYQWVWPANEGQRAREPAEVLLCQVFPVGERLLDRVRLTGIAADDLFGVDLGVPLLNKKKTDALIAVLASVPGTDVDQANHLVALAVEIREFAYAGVTLGLDQYNRALS